MKKYKLDNYGLSEVVRHKNGLSINHITIINGNITITQRAEGGGQINKDVWANANQGGQNAIKRSNTANKKSQFANGNGRSGIAGKKNDEQGGQNAKKNKIIKKKWRKK
jgi:hypothetical protein